LTGTDLGEGPELLQINIDVKRFLPRAECLLHPTPLSPGPLMHSQGRSPAVPNATREVPNLHLKTATFACKRIAE
jgi:hypothetical protein